MNNEMETVACVLENLISTNKYEEFFIDNRGLAKINNKLYPPSELRIIKTYRFEGASDPGDSAIIYVIEAADGTMAYSLDAYGVYTNHINDGYAEFIRHLNNRHVEKEIAHLITVQQELDKRNHNLNIINADLENFINTASHDLLGPLNNIELSIRLMNEIEIRDPQLQECIDIINTSITKFRALINDIAAIGAVEGDMIRLQWVDVEEMLANVEWSLESTIQKEQVIIRKNIEVKQIMFSRKNLRCIIYNLVSNAIKFRNGITPVVNIEVKKINAGVLLTVEDNGIGMAQDQLNKIFTLYGRLHDEVDGKGIGLYLAKKIVDSIEGNITVESQPDKGSKFTIYFPDPVSSKFSA